MKSIAKQYNDHGLSCLPVKHDKSPAVLTWGEKKIELSAFDGAEGIGIICGAMSGGLECLDFDNHFEDAKKNLTDFANEIKDLTEKYKFPIQSTKNGGYHLLYRCKKVEGNRKLASRPKKNKQGKWVPDAIIETRGEKGYFVAAPTEGYKVSKNSLFDIPEITIEERQIMIEIAQSFNQWKELVQYEEEKTNRPGDTYNNDPQSIEDMKGALINSGWDEVRHGMWRRPDKKDGISGTIGKVAENIFYCFSSNAYPFDEMKSYTPFQVVCLLQYNGDFKKFAAELAEKYKLEKPKQKEYGKNIESTFTENQLEKFMDESYIDFSIPVSKPPIVMKILDRGIYSYEERRLFTLGNFSAITGKSKSKKTYFCRLLMAAAVKNGAIQAKLTGNLPPNKLDVLFFDTEQSKYDSYVTSKSVLDIIGINKENYYAFDLRKYSPRERCQIIDYVLLQFKDRASYVVIDGIVDLAKALNDEEEATRVVGLLMKWTEVYNTHITVVIHQNKNDNYATGHIGSAVLKKAEAIISVTKNDMDPSRSTVKCDMIRGTMDFKDFDIYIDDNGLPVVDDNATYSKREPKF